MILRKYIKKLEKRHKKESIDRRQLNFTCDVNLITGLKLLAKYLDIPFYPLAEHVLELGISEISVKVQDSALTELLQRHLVKEHLLVRQLNPLDSHVSDRARRIDSALRFLRLIEHKAGSVEAAKQIIDRMLKGA